MACAHDVTRNQGRRHGNPLRRIPGNHERGATGHNRQHYIQRMDTKVSLQWDKNPVQVSFNTLVWDDIMPNNPTTRVLPQVESMFLGTENIIVHICSWDDDRTHNKLIWILLSLKFSQPPPNSNILLLHNIILWLIPCVKDYPSKSTNARNTNGQSWCMEPMDRVVSIIWSLQQLTFLLIEKEWEPKFSWGPLSLLHRKDSAQVHIKKYWLWAKSILPCSTLYRPSGKMVNKSHMGIQSQAVKNMRFISSL